MATPTRPRRKSSPAATPAPTDDAATAARAAVEPSDAPPRRRSPRARGAAAGPHADADAGSATIAAASAPATPPAAAAAAAKSPAADAATAPKRRRPSKADASAAQPSAADTPAAADAGPSRPDAPDTAAKGRRKAAARAAPGKSTRGSAARSRAQAAPGPAADPIVVEAPAPAAATAGLAPPAAEDAAAPAGPDALQPETAGASPPPAAATAATAAATAATAAATAAVAAETASPEAEAPPAAAKRRRQSAAGTAAASAPRQRARGATTRRRADADADADAAAAPADDGVAAPGHPPPQAADAALALADDRPARSAVRLFEGEALRHPVWQAGRGCPAELDELARAALGSADGAPGPAWADALPQLVQLARRHGHPLDIDDAVWLHGAAERDARWRLQQLETACPQGAASAALQSLLRATRLPDYQAEGALFAVVAGRALIADDRGLGKRVQAIAAAALWRRHFGLRRVLVLCHAAQRADWAHEWTRRAGHTLAAAPVVMQGPMHERAALWAAPSEVRIVDPETLAQDDAHWRSWAPELVIVDEPQRLPGWRAADAPHALVLCGAPLAESPLLHEIIDWLDRTRHGALHALMRVQAAREQGLALDDAALAQLDDALSRVMLQRLRSEVAAQLPAQVHTSRVVTLGPAQRQAHDRLLHELREALERWQTSGHLGDARQWPLAALPARLADACHRVQPGAADSPLTAATVAAVQAQLDDWAARTPVAIAIACASAADRAQLAAQLVLPAPVAWLEGDAAVPAQVEVVLGVGTPWQMPATDEPTEPGRQWVHVVAEASLELALCDTLASRRDLPLWDAAQGFRHGRALQAWMQAWQQALDELLHQ